MNDYKLLPDDPKLTAYALGELEGAERAAVEAALRGDPVARAAVAEIRAVGLQLEDALAEEASQEPVAQKNGAATTASLVSVAILPGTDPSKLDGGYRFNGRPSPLAQVIKFPQFYYVAGGLAVACFAVAASNGLLTATTPSIETIKRDRITDFPMGVTEFTQDERSSNTALACAQGSRRRAELQHLQVATQTTVAEARFGR